MLRPLIMYEFTLPVVDKNEGLSEFFRLIFKINRTVIFFSLYFTESLPFSHTYYKERVYLFLCYK